MAMQVSEGHLRDKKGNKEMHIRKFKADTSLGQVEHKVVKGSEGSVEYHYETLRMRPRNAISSGLAIQQGTDDNEFSQTIDVLTTSRSTTEIKKTSYSKRKGTNNSSSLGMNCCAFIFIVVLILWFLNIGK